MLRSLVGSEMCIRDREGEAFNAKQIPVLYQPWRIHQRLGVVVVIYCGLSYIVLAYFLLAVESESLNGNRTLGWYAAFYVVCQLLKTAGKRLGVAADRIKFGTFSMYFALEYLLTLFYYTFYRTLFDKISDYRVFIALQALHLLTEWLLFPFKASATCYRWYQSVDEWATHRFDSSQNLCHMTLRSLILAPGVRCHRHLQCAVTMELAIRTLCSVSSGIANVAITLLISHGPEYITAQFKNTTADVTRTVLFVSGALVTELLNLCVMETCFFRPRGLSVIASASIGLFRQRRYSWNVFFVTTVLLFNIIYTKLGLVKAT
eukprot:TRINITY_DN7238_c0_g1_i5.p1 TRINITY_DN7238_c0_g1~~TRINITY_DN7238_c0_g1_i5.p1  ORF type:complete len:319 (+),score=45.43 TRINITY_DN7238_c0_g1_i5:104-1060(+)